MLQSLTQAKMMVSPQTDSMRKTTVGWKFRVKWKNESITWAPLKDLKESNLVEVAEYVEARGIKSEPAFA